MVDFVKEGVLPSDIGAKSKEVLDEKRHLGKEANFEKFKADEAQTPSDCREEIVARLAHIELDEGRSSVRNASARGMHAVGKGFD